MNEDKLIHSSFEGIPNAIVGDILSRLPTKSCLNCKLVCKDWYHVIIDPHFIDMRRSHGWYTTLLLRGASEKERKIFVLLDLHKSVKVDGMRSLSVSADTLIRFKPIFYQRKNEGRLVNECNGVLCLESKYKWGNITICNLLTGKHMAVKQTWRRYCDVKVYGVGSCPVSHQFKVLRVLTYGFERKTSCVAEIQTLGTNDWRVIGDAKRDDLCQSTSFLNGSIHWHSYEDRCIRTFHFGHEQFSRIELPNVLAKCYYDVGVFDSFLCVSEFKKGKHPLNIWIMKIYGVKESWVKQYAFQSEMWWTCIPVVRNDSEEVTVSDSGITMGKIESRTSEEMVDFVGVQNFTVMAFNPNFSKSHVFGWK